MTQLILYKYEDESEALALAKYYGMQHMNVRWAPKTFTMFDRVWSYGFEMESPDDGWLIVGTRRYPSQKVKVLPKIRDNVFDPKHFKEYLS